MDRYIIEAFKDKLLDKKLEVEATLRRMKKNGTAEQNQYSPTELSNYDNHPAEMGTQLFELEHNNALRVHEENLLGEINQALGKINNGDYGKCEDCNNSISEERLDAIPYTRLCKICEQDKSNTLEMLSKTRPIEEKVLRVPLGRKHFNQRDDDEYEGLDVLNDLIKHGSTDTPQDMGGYQDYENFYTNDIDEQGIVDDIDNISNEQYKKQLPD